ncbi:trigger factor [Jonesia denitrificans]|uniref:Trigger factor n=1 Tax=Jonesia denitrificans (strain ATCC 14870 / DSM 20603 / BCRC 15368 / CIP 55.134 / JCM 11481 / NBRC 15587 / NCTC 10816 / Prevot 55134) TaxID=471856 RepID=C7R2Y8_JONDD|nr:trigger factor [Jonesia denitrificans]ACV08610.1 trigger factor [Jonesia denitrificans DSM 20603]ASE07770.1 trigger factor [Jonesia denitrificans]QXB42384.1 trigger factor [Jonesia denitrificans]SQH20597.1 Trigger factor [Jonesia denitrificans]
MKSTVETLDPTKAKLTVEVEYDELQPAIEHAYTHIAQDITIPGFRKGKVPPRIIDQRIGRAAVLEHAVNEALPGFYRDALAQSELRPLGQPSVEVTKVPLGDDEQGNLEFVVELEVRPDFDLPELDGLSLQVPNVTVSDEDVEERLTSLRERFGTLVGVDRPAADGDFVVIDLTAKIGDETVDSVSGISYEIGTGNMLEGLDEALTGLSADETTTFTAPLAGGDHAGEEATVTVTATAVKERQLPEADDDFAQMASEFDTIDELKDDLREQAKNAAASNQAVAARDLLVAELNKVEFPLPAGVIEAEVNRHLEGEGRLEDDEHRAEVTQETTTALKNQLLLDTLAEKLEVKVAQQELLDYLISASRQYGMDPQQFISTLDQQGQIPAMVGEVARSKSLAVALRSIEVKDEDGNVVDLSEFIGSDEDDAAAEEIAKAAQQAAEGDSEEQATEDASH